MNSSPVSAQTSGSKAAPTVGICLSGGGALGFAHIGALQALEEHGIHATHLSGTSMGSIVGVMYAAGYTPAQILEMVKEEKAYKMGTIFKLNLSKPRRTVQNTNCSRFSINIFLSITSTIFKFLFMFAVSSLKREPCILFIRGINSKILWLLQPPFPWFMSILQLMGLIMWMAA